MSAPSPVRAVGLVVARHKTGAVELARDLASALHALGVEVRCPPVLAGHLRSPVACVSDEELVHADLVMVLGGDGTFLHYASLAAPLGVPLLGVYVGGFGFLTETESDSLLERLPAIASGQFEIEDRMLLEAALEGEALTLALNEVVVHRGSVPGLLACEVWLDGEPVGEYRGDGVIVATPTGSTAYSLAAGGPVVHPEIEALVVTPMLQHTLHIRPLVVGAGRRVEIRLTGGYWSRRDGATVACDGANLGILREGQWLRVRKAETALRVARLGPAAFLARLRQKLQWGAAP